MFLRSVLKGFLVAIVCYFIFFTINLYSGCDVASLTALEYVMVWFNTQNKFN